MKAGLIVMAPFSNSIIRDWPARHFRRLIQLCIEQLQLRVIVVGTKDQRESANHIIRGLPAPDVENRCGTLPWEALEDLLRTAEAIVANNSGIAHLGASLGARVLCIFGGSHSVAEWHPKGPHIMVLHQRLPCTPCATDFYLDCPNEMRCLNGLTPELVVEQLALHAAGGRSAKNPLPAAAMPLQ